jgi:two-component system CheB/CheR fusion protein
VSTVDERSVRDLDDGLDRLLAKIASEHGVPCLGYKPSCLRRRVSVRLRATGTETFAAYAALLDAQPEEWSRLLDALTINVTGFFRDHSVYRVLREQVIPSLAEAQSGFVRGWSAGCASGEEAWSVAMLLAERAGVERTRVLATDIDTQCLARATAGAYPSIIAREMPEELQRQWWSGYEPVVVSDALRRCVSFERFNLLTDQAPPSAYDVITCRNVLIYFARDAQEALFMRFADALRMGGVLVLGKVEILSGPARARFVPIDARERIYRRVA